MKAAARLFFATLAVVCLVVYAAKAAPGFALGVDDAHISLVYASHLAVVLVGIPGSSAPQIPSR